MNKVINSKRMCFNAHPPLSCDCETSKEIVMLKQLQTHKYLKIML